MQTKKITSKIKIFLMIQSVAFLASYNSFSSEHGIRIFEKDEIEILSPIRVSEKDIVLINKGQENYNTYLMCTDFQNKNGIGETYFEIYVNGNNKKIGEILLYSYPEGKCLEFANEFPTIKLVNIEICENFQRKKSGTQALETLFRKLQKSKTVPEDIKIWGEYNIKDTPYMEKMLNQFGFSQDEKLSDIRLFYANLNSIKFPHYVEKIEEESVKSIEDPSDNSAFKLMKEKADKGDVPFMYSVGMMYLRIEGDLSANIKKGKEYLVKAANAGQGLALYHLGLLQLNGSKNTKKNIQNALIYLNKAIDKGETSAMIKVALLYNEGEIVTKDQHKALELLEKAKKKGDLQASRFLKKIQKKLNIEVTEDPITENKFSFEEKEKEKNPHIKAISADTYLGAMRMEGIKMGERMLIEAANEGSIFAMYRLGLLYEEGQKGIKKDIKATVNWYNKAIKEERLLYQKTNKKTEEYFESHIEPVACYAMYRLGLLYSNDKEGMKNLEKALELLKDAYREKIAAKLKSNSFYSLLQSMNLDNETQNFLYFFKNMDRSTSKDSSITKEEIKKEIEKVNEALEIEKLYMPLSLNKKVKRKILNF